MAYSPLPRTRVQHTPGRRYTTVGSTTTPAQQRAAARAAASWAYDHGGADVCRLLLDMLGIEVAR